MSDTITIGELVESPPREMMPWAIMVLLSHYDTDDFLKHFNIDASNHDNTVTVEMRINGVEVSPAEIFKQLNNQHEDMVKRCAMELIQEKIKGVDAVTELLENVRSLVQREASAALGVDWETRW